MLKALFSALVLVSVRVAAFTNRMEPVSAAALDAAGKAVELAIGLVGAMSLFMGLMKVAQDGGLLKLIARAAAPVMKRLFPDVPADHPAMSSMILTIASNILGLGNAATPFGIRAMQELERLNPVKGTASNAMVLFLAINTAGLAILPTSVVALRASAGSKDPAGIIFATWLASGFATIVAIVAARSLARLPAFRVAPADGAAHEAASAEPLPETPEEPERKPPRFGRSAAVAYAAAVVVALVLYAVRESSVRSWSEIARSVLSYWMIPSLIAGIVLFGWARGVRVYESLVGGAKEGFTVALRIIPYLVAILVAVAMFRASGGLDAFVAAISPVTSLIGLPAQLVPMALLRPLSGSGSFGLMSDIIGTHGPDSYLGYLASTMQGATDTTFYILAVYFGAVGIRRTRHAVAAGLLTDAAGIAAAVLICRLFRGGT